MVMIDVIFLQHTLILSKVTLMRRFYNDTIYDKSNRLVKLIINANSELSLKPNMTSVWHLANDERILQTRNIGIG